MNLNLVTLLFTVLLILQIFTIGWTKRSGGGRRRPSGGGHSFGSGHSKKSSKRGQAYHTNNGRPQHNVHVPQNQMTSGQRYSSGGGASGSQLLVSGLTGAAVGAGTFALLHSAVGHSHGQQQPTPMYYYGDRFQKATNGQIPRGKILCNVSLPSNETNNSIYSNLTANSSLDNSSMPIVDNTTSIAQSIVYMCNLKNEQCCAGYRCCPRQKSTKIWVEKAEGVMKSWIGVLLAILGVFFMACCACCLFRCCKRVQKNHWYQRHHENHGSNYINAYMEPLPMFQQQNQNMLHNPPYDVTSGHPTNFAGSAPSYANPTYVMSQQIYPWNMANSGYSGNAIDFTQSSTSLIEKPPISTQKNVEDHHQRLQSQQQQSGGYFHGASGYRVEGY